MGDSVVADGSANEGAIASDNQSVTPNPNDTILNGDDGKGAAGDGQNADGTILGADATKGDDKGEDKAAVVPEKYEPFEMSEGVMMTDEAVEGFSGIAKELGLSQEQAQKLVTFQSEMVSKQIQEQIASSDKISADWRKETMTMLGANSEQQIAVANKVLEARPELRDVLVDTRLANNPQVVKLIVDFGKLVSEDPGSDGASSGDVKKTREEKLYGKK